MQCCNQEMRDWSFHYPSVSSERVPHFYCLHCSSHFYKDRMYTQEEWFFFINEETYSQYLRRQAEAREAEANDLLQSAHAHELINRRNPEGSND